MNIVNPFFTDLNSLKSSKKLPLDARRIGSNNFYSPGKLMISGEYLVLDGARSLALPTMLGQSLSIKSKKTFASPVLKWRGFDYKNEEWIYVEFELSNFSVLKTSNEEVALILQNIFRSVRKLNIHFLREHKEYEVNSKVEFPLHWGLGSSSSLLYNISQWAYVSPFELSKMTFGGSGCDIAVAQARGAVSYKKNENSQEWKPLNLNYSFKNNLYFIHLDNKQNTRSEINYYYSLTKDNNFSKDVERISELTDLFIECDKLSLFQEYMSEHESILSKNLKRKKVQDLYFHDFEGATKSLGAWGGDFIMAACDLGDEYIERYFKNKGFHTIIAYKDIVTDSNIYNQ